MKQALVIHPRFFILGGGELLCLKVCEALQASGYEVHLTSDTFDIAAVERVYGMGQVLARCHWFQIPAFHPRFEHFLAFQRMLYAIRVKNLLTRHRWTVAFSTQSSLFIVPTRRLYHFIYDIVDLFAYPHGLWSSIEKVNLRGRAFQWHLYYAGLRLMKKLLYRENPTATHFFALSHTVLDELHHHGYKNCSLIYPPTRTDFLPQPKQPWIIQVTRIVPQKQLERFFEIARHLPEYRFIIVGRDSPILRSLNPHYAEGLMAEKPGNVDYVDAPIKEVPELLEQSRVYLYTGEEPGIGIALMEACGAGCIPIASRIGGGGEVIDGLGAGYKFTDIEDGVEKVKLALEQPSWTPEELREKALKAFSPETFQAKIRDLL